MAKPDHKTQFAELVDPARMVRWAGPVFVGCSLVLIPWTIYLGYSLPSRQLSPHYNIAWAGFDVLELVALGATGFFALRRSKYLAVASATAAALLVVDAWFDVMTSPRQQVPIAIASAVLIELPLAAVCGWLSYQTGSLNDRGMTLLFRRGLRRGR
jgi:hypothetical protein